MILSQLARDVYAIPVSTVASEFVFSTGGCILDPFRSSLGPKMVEALVVLKIDCNWIQYMLIIEWKFQHMTWNIMKMLNWVSKNKKISVSKQFEQLVLLPSSFLSYVISSFYLLFRI